MRLLTGFCPNEKIKKFLKKGNKKLEPLLDIMWIVKQHGKQIAHSHECDDEAHHKDDSLNLDSD